MNIYLMRHGETDWNVQHRMQGHSDIPLNRRGRMQAQKAARGMLALPIDRILTSPLSRAKQTAQTVAAGRGVPVLIEERLIEMGFGAMEGAVLPEHPELQGIFSDPAHYVPGEGAESYAQLDARCRAVLEEVLPPLEENYHDVLLVSHGAFIRGVVQRVLDRPLSQFWHDPPQKNCTCTVLELSGGKYTLIEEGRSYG